MNANLTVNQANRDKVSTHAAWLKENMVLANGSRVLKVEGTPADERVLITLKQGDRIVTESVLRDTEVKIYA